MLPLLALLGQGDRYFGTDSTAPIVDGWSSPTISLYVTDPAPLKYKAHRIADVWIRGGRGWDCACSYCAEFRAAHPPDIDRAQKWWRDQGEPKIQKEMLERDGPLSAWLPFLGYAADDDLRREAGLARVGHNHWILRQLELEIRKQSDNWSDLLGWVEGIVESYQQASGSPAWKAAVVEASSLARAVGERLHHSQTDVTGTAGMSVCSGPRHDQIMSLDCLASHPSSRALLQATLEQLRQTPDLPRSWTSLQPMATALAGSAAMTLDILRANTTAVQARVRTQAQHATAWRTVLSQANAQLQDDAPLLRLAELIARAASCAQTPFVTMYVAASTTSFCLSYLAANLAAASPDGEADDSSPLDQSTAQWLASFTKEAAEFTHHGFAQFYELFASADPTLASAQTLAQTILDQARPRGLAIGHVFGSLWRQGIGSELLDQAGPIVLELAESSARLKLLVAYAAHTLAHSHAVTAQSWLQAEQHTAQLDFASNVPTGARARVDELGDLDGGTLVEIAGLIDTVTLEDDPSPPKFSSFVVLRALDSDASVRLRAHMFSLEKNGIAKGACCKVRGFVRREQPWIDDGDTGLDIDRVSLTKLRKRSWMDDVTYRMRPFFRLYQDEMNLFNTPGGE